MVVTLQERGLMLAEPLILNRKSKKKKKIKHLKFERLWVHQFETSVRKATANERAAEFQASGSCASLTGPSILAGGPVSECTGTCYSPEGKADSGPFSVCYQYHW